MFRRNTEVMIKKLLSLFPNQSHKTVGCMRRFACRNFQIPYTVDSKLSYTPCYTQYGLLKYKLKLKN